MALTVPASLALKAGATILATLLARLPRPASRAQLLIRWTTHLCHAAPWKTSEMARLSVYVKQVMNKMARTI